MRQSQAWKNLERRVAEALGGKRIVRGNNFAVSDIDVKVPDFPHLAIDAKYRRAQPWKHHAFVEEIAKKYCGKGELTTPVLVTKSGGERGEYVTLRLQDYAALLNAIRGLRPDIEAYRPDPAELDRVLEWINGD